MDNLNQAEINRKSFEEVEIALRRKRQELRQKQLAAMLEHCMPSTAELKQILLRSEKEEK